MCSILFLTMELIILDHGQNIVSISHYLDHGLAFWWIYMSHQIKHLHRTKHLFRGR